MKKVSTILFLLIAVCQISFTNSYVTKNLASLVVKPLKRPIVFTSNEFVDISIPVDIPCAGETVTLEGKLHVLSHVTINGNNLMSISHFQPQGISGVGSISGDKYRGTGVTQEIFKGSLINNQFTFSFINNFRIIGQGTGNNYVVHELIHITVNANGTTSSNVDNFRVECN